MGTNSVFLCVRTSNFSSNTVPHFLLTALGESVMISSDGI